MQLASMVHHGNGRGERREAHQLHQQHLLYSSRPQTRAHQPHAEVAAVLDSNPYSSHIPLDYSYRAPQSPPSPPVEEVNKPSLPSISSLLGIADGEKGGQETATQPQTQSQSTSQQQQQQQQHHASSLQHAEIPSNQHPQAFGATIVSNPRMTLPPTPPMQPDSVIDGNQSPSAMSQSSVNAMPYYLGQSLNNMDPERQRQQVARATLMKRPSVASQPSMSPYTTSPYAHSPYGSSSGPGSSGSYYSPESQVYTSAAMYQQRPLPSNFPPPAVPIPMLGTTNTANPWQHHHYISASSQAAFPQSQDRYICQTCNKAFSRPSSLRIHSHSHTGEKPYKCPQPGCGKAFSVRSNMKRHERGCHASANGTISAS